MDCGLKATHPGRATAKVGIAPPSRSLTGSMKDIMGTSGLVWHQWKKHGSCSDLAAEIYFEISRNAYENITRPSLFRRLKELVTLRAEIVETALDYQGGFRKNPNAHSHWLKTGLGNPS